MGTKDHTNETHSPQQIEDTKLGMLLLSNVRKNAKEGDVSELVRGLMEHLSMANLELNDITSSIDEIVDHLRFGINAAIANNYCEIAHALKNGQAVGDLLRYGYDMTQGSKKAEDWLLALAAELAAKKHALDNRKAIDKIFNPPPAEAGGASEFYDPFAALHDAVADKNTGDDLDRSLIAKGIVATKAGESALARLIDLERSVAQQGEGANPSSSRSIHDAGTPSHCASQEAVYGDDVVDMDTVGAELIEEPETTETSVIRALTERPPSLPHERLHAGS